MSSTINSQPPTLFDLNPLKSIAIPNVGRIKPKGLVLIIGPNSAGKTQLLRDIHSRILGQTRKLVVCDDIEINRPKELAPLLDTLIENKHIRRRVDSNNHVYFDALIPEFGNNSQNWSLVEHQVHSFFANPVSVGTTERDGTSDKFLEHFGRSFIVSLFLDRRLTVTDTVNSFDYMTGFPANELQALYMNPNAKHLLAKEAQTVFGKALWLDHTRSNLLCFRVGIGPDVPPAEDRLEPSKMASYRLIEDEGDGFKSYIAICLTLLLGKQPVVLIDEPEMCLHPPQAYALGRFIGKYGISSDHTTFVATHSSHVLRGIIEETEQLEVIRLSRTEAQFSGHCVPKETLRESVKKPSTKSESILDGLFAEAVTVVESEGDRLLYSTTWDKVATEYSHDVHFVSVGGIGGISDPCALYRNLSIPVCVAADLDVIRELATFEKILKAVAPDESVQGLMANCRQIIDRVKSLGPLYNEEQTRSSLNKILAKDFDWKDIEQLNSIRSTLSNLSRGLSQTARLKQGVDSLKGNDVYHDLLAFLNRCREYGIFLVPVGELEDWIPNLVQNGPSKKKKAEWANYAATQIRESPPDDDNIWKFVRSMSSFQQHEIKRIKGY